MVQVVEVLSRLAVVDSEAVARTRCLVGLLLEAVELLVVAVEGAAPAAAVVAAVVAAGTAVAEDLPVAAL